MCGAQQRGNIAIPRACQTGKPSLHFFTYLCAPHLWCGIAQRVGGGQRRVRAFARPGAAALQAPARHRVAPRHVLRADVAVQLRMHTGVHKVLARHAAVGVAYNMGRLPV